VDFDFDQDQYENAIAGQEDIEEIHEPILYTDAQNQYLRQQETMFGIKKDMSFSTRPCLLKNGKKGQSDWRVYLEIAKVIESADSISAADADAIVELIKTLSAANGKEVPMPMEYKQILRRVLHSMDQRKIPVFKYWITPPVKLFGKDSKLNKCPCVFKDPLQCIARHLGDNSVVGDAGQFFKENYTPNGKGSKRVLGECYEAEYFKKSEKQLREKHGAHMHVLAIFISSDKTVLTRGGTVNATPIYYSIGNLDMKVINSDLGTDLLGYMPSVSDTKAVIKNALRDIGCDGKTLNQEVISLYNRYLEQQVSVETYLYMVSTWFLHGLYM
jgi:hypothetical protein